MRWPRKSRGKVFALLGTRLILGVFLAVVAMGPNLPGWALFGAREPFVA